MADLKFIGVNFPSEQFQRQADPAVDRLLTDLIGPSGGVGGPLVVSPVSAVTGTNLVLDVKNGTSSVLTTDGGGTLRVLSGADETLRITNFGTQAQVLAGSNSFPDVTPHYSFLDETTSGLGLDFPGQVSLYVDTGPVITLLQTHVILPNGTAAAPGVRLSGASTTGLFAPGTDILGFSASGVEVARVQAPSGANPTLTVAAGSAVAPALTFAGSSTGTGWHASTADNVTISLLGTDRWAFLGDVIQSPRPSPIIRTSGANGSMYVRGNVTSGTTSNRKAVALQNGTGGATAFTGAATGHQVLLYMDATVNHTVAAAGLGFSLIEGDLTQTSIAGLDPYRLIDLMIGGSTVFEVTAGATPGLVRTADGSIAAPAYSFLSSPTLGLYAFDASNISIAIGGSNEVWRFGVSDITFTRGANQGIKQGLNNFSMHATGRISTSNTNPSFQFNNVGNFAGSGQQVGIEIDYTIAQAAGTGGMDHLQILSTNTSLGTGDTNLIHAKVGGVSVFKVKNDNDTLASKGQVQVVGGTSAIPAYSFLDDPTTGFFLSSAANIDVSTGGSVRWRFDGTRFTALVNGCALTMGTVNSELLIRTRRTGVAGVGLTIDNNAQSYSAGSGAQTHIAISTAVNQVASTASFDLVSADVTNTALGSGDQNILHLKIGGSSVLKIKNSTTAAIQGQIQANDGATSSPAYGFMSDPGTGLYFSGANSFSAVSGSTLVATFAYNGGNTQIRLPDGSNLSPSLAFISDTNTGLYRYGTDAIAFVGNNNENFIVDGQAGIPQVRVIIGSGAGTPSYSFINDSDTGMYQDGADQLGFAVSGVKIVGVTGSNVNSIVPFRGANGSATAPTYSFTSGTNTGFYYNSGTTAIQIATNGIFRAALTTTEFLINIPIQGADGSAAVPTHGFSTATSAGMYLVSSTNLGFSVSNGLRMTVTATDTSPGADNSYSLGTASLRWSDVFAVQTTIGDLTMRDPKATRGDKDASHWKLIEGQDTIHLYNVRTGKKYALALKETDMSPEDEEILNSERKRFGWED